MVRVKKRAARLKTRWTDEQLHRLLCSGAPALYSLIEQTPNADEWNLLQPSWDANHETLLAEYRAKRPGKRPFAWWKWEASEPRDESMPETEQLWRLGELDEAEARDHFENTGYGLPAKWPTDYRRAWFWWHQRREKTPRRYELPEVFDLFDQRLLTPDERGRLQDLSGDRYGASKVYTPIHHIDRYKEPSFTVEQLQAMGLHAAAELWNSL